MVLPAPWCKAIDALGEIIVIAPEEHPAIETTKPATAMGRKKRKGMMEPLGEVRARIMQ